METIHPIIYGLDISDSSKVFFNNLKLYDIINDYKVVIDKDVSIEANKNWWRFSMADIPPSLKNDIKTFYHSVMKSRAEYLAKHHMGKKMIFYAWYDGQSGNFNFSLISDDNTSLPFGCIVNKVEKLEDIIQDFVDDKYKGCIPIDECVKLNPNDINEDDEEVKITLNVYSIILPS